MPGPCTSAGAARQTALCRAYGAPTGATGERVPIAPEILQDTAVDGWYQLDTYDHVVVPLP